LQQLYGALFVVSIYMNIELLILHALPTLHPSDSIDRALAILEENEINGLPVTEEEHYLGLVTEDNLLEVSDPSATLAQSDLLHYKPAISAATHPLDAICVMHQSSLPVLPVLDAEQKYIGSITKEKLLQYIAENTGVNNPGGILVIEIPPRNYSMFEVARICENEDTIILSMFTRTNERGMLEITLKLNRTVLDAVVSSFERHKYHVVEVYGRDSNADDIMDKYNLLMNYLNM
jgi:acetoin utilization protein AcuB